MMPRESMTPRERWLAVLKYQKPDRVPMDYWSTPEFTEKLKKHLGCDTLTHALEKLHVDYVVSVGPRYVGPPLPKGTDVFGCAYRDIDYGTGVYGEVVARSLFSPIRTCAAMCKPLWT
jgi:uroporphyrinogen decarboxylase